MDVDDPVYGKFSVREPVITELVESAPMQRLRRINQSGALQYVDPRKYTNTRFSHSLGVHYLLRKFNASMEEQIAGLLHDVGHTAFSHVSDYLFDDGARKQDYNDRMMRTVVMRSEIPAILRSHGFDVEEILGKGRFTLMKLPVPDICADVLDYFFRDAVVFGLRKGILDEVRLFMSSLQVIPGDSAADTTAYDRGYDRGSGRPVGCGSSRSDAVGRSDAAGRQFVFSNIEMAKRAALGFMECNRRFWSSPEGFASYHLLSEALKESMGSGHIRMDDLMLTDDELFMKLKRSGAGVAEKLRKLEGLRAFESPNGSILGVTKARYIDPMVLQKGRIRRLSEYDGEFKSSMEEFSASMEKGFHIKIL